eukprot:1841225-Pleurochrysis_carterae.AAC.1
MRRWGCLSDCTPCSPVSLSLPSDTLRGSALRPMIRPCSSPYKVIVKGETLVTNGPTSDQPACTDNRQNKQGKKVVSIQMRRARIVCRPCATKHDPISMRCIPFEYVIPHAFRCAEMPLVTLIWTRAPADLYKCLEVFSSFRTERTATSQLAVSPASAVPFPSFRYTCHLELCTHINIKQRAREKTNAQ